MVAHVLERENPKEFSQYKTESNHVKGKMQFSIVFIFNTILLACIYLYSYNILLNIIENIASWSKSALYCDPMTKALKKRCGVLLVMVFGLLAMTPRNPIINKPFS